MTSAPAPAPALHLPRVLCLHGGGVSADIFRAQARALIAHLPDFRLVFADGPHLCSAGPGILPVYAAHGPFRRWLRWLPEHPPIDDDSAVAEIFYNLDTAIAADPGTGPWVGLLGFSQGAKLAASLLYDQQIRAEKSDPGPRPTDYRFAVLLAGRAPLVSLCDHSSGPECAAPGQLSEDFRFEGVSKHLLRLPTIHVHGLKDPGLHLHRNLYTQYCDPKHSTVLEWDGDHRVPIKSTDVRPICTEIYRVAREVGVQV